MESCILDRLTSKDDKDACATAEKISDESMESDKWYSSFDEFAALLSHSKSLVRNRALHILAANAQWDKENRFDGIIDEYLLHITEDKPITARQCVKFLPAIAKSIPHLADKILEALKTADISCYKDTMRPLIKKDIENCIEMIESQ